MCIVITYKHTKYAVWFIKNKNDVTKVKKKLKNYHFIIDQKSLSFYFNLILTWLHNNKHKKIIKKLTKPWRYVTCI